MFERQFVEFRTSPLGFDVDEEVANFRWRCADQQHFPNKENYDSRAVYTRTAKTTAAFVADFRAGEWGRLQDLGC